VSEKFTVVNSVPPEAASFINRLGTVRYLLGLRGPPGENDMSIYEALGIGYVVISTAFFTAQVIYFGIKGLDYMHRLVERAQAEESLDLQRSLSIRRELAKVK
jgi:hypothetical protein